MESVRKIKSYKDKKSLGEEMPRKIVGFLTDFGLTDPYVGQVKAVMLSLNPDIEIIDLGHLIEPFCITCGAYSVYSSYKYLPEGSGILAVVDPGVGSSRRALIVEAFGRIFVGPDNGVLWQVITEDDSSKIFVINVNSIKLGWPISSTFHGRDLFGPALAIALKDGIEKVAGRPLGIRDIVKLSLKEEKLVNGEKCYKVIYIDRFGNVALSVTKKDRSIPQEGERLEIRTPKGIFFATVSPSFSLVPKGGLAIYFNSFDFLEIAVNQGSAAKLLGVEIGDEVCLKNMT